MSKAAQILAEAKAAEEKAAALSAYLRNGDGENLLIKHSEQWRVIFELRNAYDQLNKALTARAKMEEVRS